MNSANIDLVRWICAEWERGDYSSTEWQHPDLEFVIADGPTPGRWTGLGGITEGWGDFLRAWDGFHAVAEECRALDDETVLVLVRMGGKGKASGLELGQMWAKAAIVFHLRDGKVTRMVNYFDRGGALADLGLAPGDGSPDS